MHSNSRTKGERVKSDCNNITLFQAIDGLGFVIRAVPPDPLVSCTETQSTSSFLSSDELPLHRPYYLLFEAQPEDLRSRRSVILC